MKLSHLISISLSFLSTLQAQPNIKWQKSFGGTQLDECHGVAETFDKGFILVGFTESPDGHVSSLHGGWDAWVIKLSTTGELEWEKTYGGTGYDVGYSIVQTKDSGYVFSAMTTSSDGQVTGAHGKDDCWIVKLDKNGNIEWQKTLGGSQNDVPYFVQQTDDLGFIVSASTISSDGDVSFSRGGLDYWICKLNKNGELEWEKTYGGSNHDVSVCIRQTIDKGYIVGGFTYSVDGDISGHYPGGAIDFWVLKLNSTGGIEWTKILGGTGSDEMNVVLQTIDGGYLIGGSSNSTDGNIISSHGGYDQCLIKLDPSGNVLWQKSYGGSLHDDLTSIDETEGGTGFIITGSSLSSDGDATFNQGDDDFWIVKADSSGNKIWQRSFGGNGADRPNDIIQTSDGTFLAAGRTQSTNGNVTNSFGQTDLWVLKIGSPVGINSLSDATFQLRIVSGSPGQRQVILEGENLLDSFPLYLHIYDAVGKQVTSLRIDHPTTALNLNEFPTGVYLYTLSKDNVTVGSGKLMLE